MKKSAKKNVKHFNNRVVRQKLRQAIIDYMKGKTDGVDVPSEKEVDIWSWD